jgi:hypothetical protein
MSELSLQQQIKVFEDTLNYITEDNHASGLCYHIKRSLNNLLSKKISDKKISQLIPIFTYENARKWVGVTYDDPKLWWWAFGRVSYSRRIEFLKRCISELEKQMEEAKR